MYSERTQVLLSPEQRSRLERLAAKRNVSIGALIREAVDAYTRPTRTTRAEAAEALFAVAAPVADWEQMKAEIVRAATR